MRPPPPPSAENRAKAREALDAKIAAGARYRRDFMDAQVWDNLAKTRGVRLPPWWVAPTPGKLNSWWKRLGEVPFREAFGASPARIIELNPDYPLRAFVGQMLEMSNG